MLRITTPAAAAAAVRATVKPAPRRAARAGPYADSSTGNIIISPMHVLRSVDGAQLLGMVAFDLQLTTISSTLHDLLAYNSRCARRHTPAG